MSSFNDVNHSRC